MNGEYINIIPRHGDAINEVVFNKEATLHSIHKYAKSVLEFQEKSMSTHVWTFSAPIPNRIKERRFQFTGIDFQLELTDKGFDNAFHYEAPFSTYHIDENLGPLSLETHFNGAIGYPFQLYFKNSYQLKEKEFIIIGYVRDESETDISFGTGWHPYISIGKSVDLLQLKVPGKKTFEQNSQHMPNGIIPENRNFLELNVISDKFMNGCYILENSDLAHIYDAQKDLNIVVAQQTAERAYNYRMYCTPPERDCLAVEPMTAAPDAFNYGHGLITLLRREELELCFSMALGG